MGGLSAGVTSGGAMIGGVAKPLIVLAAEAEAVYRSEWESLVRLGGLLVGDYRVGEDLAQEAFARLLGRLPEVEDPSAYVRGILVNLSRSWIRRSILARRYPPERPYEVPGPEQAADRVAAQVEIRRALSGLSTRQREAVVLRFYGGLTEVEVAAAMGVSVGSVKTHMHRAMACLSERMEDLR